MANVVIPLMAPCSRLGVGSDVEGDWKWKHYYAFGEDHRWIDMYVCLQNVEMKNNSSELDSKKRIWNI
jgi:hypothetical protein